MPLKIQRVPRGLNELLSIFGGATPQELEDRARGTLDLLQFYGLQQRQNFAATNAAQGSGTTFVVPLPSSRWNVLWGASYAANGAVGMTTLAIQLRVNGVKVAFYNAPNPAVAIENSISFWPAAPLLLEPGSVVEGFLQTAGVAVAATAVQGLASPIG